MNNDLYLKYLMELDKLPDFVSSKKDIHVKVPYKKYVEYEHEYYSRLLLNPAREFNISVEASYRTPRGRNYYHDSRTYDEVRIMEAMHDIENEDVRKQSVAYQRTSMTPRMRYNVMQRDGFRCVICGRSADKDGVKLHVDHIQPVSKGGKTVMDNLRTLCQDCNLGKGNQYDPDGLN